MAAPHYALGGGFFLRSLPDLRSLLSGRPDPPKPLVERFLRSRPDLRSLPERRSTLTMSPSLFTDNLKVGMPFSGTPSLFTDNLKVGMPFSGTTLPIKLVVLVSEASTPRLKLSWP
jgi:hypothetical protein